jgi:hypothetical protein
MMIGHVEWYHDVDEENTSRHTTAHPSMTEIDRLLAQLDAWAYPSFRLARDGEGKRHPKLTVYGGPHGYAIWLSLGNQDGQPTGEMISYSDPRLRDSSQTCHSIGRTYPGIEIEEHLLTTDSELVKVLINYFAMTGYWKPEVPFIVERDDDDGVVRQYDQ